MYLLMPLKTVMMYDIERKNIQLEKNSFWDIDLQSHTLLKLSKREAQGHF